jgi:hypothetical protein
MHAAQSPVLRGSLWRLEAQKNVALNANPNKFRATGAHGARGLNGQSF